MSTLKHKTISGIKWMFAASIVQRVILFAGTVILARILSPADFGLFALAFVLIDGFQIFRSLGFDTALIRRKDDIEKACNTAFFLIPAMGLILFALVFFFAPIGAGFMKNPQLTGIIRTLAVIFVISTFGKVPQTVLYRDMKFKYKAIAEASGVLIFSSTAVILALNKFGVYSLVYAFILRNLVQVGLEWYFSGWKPKFEFDKTIARDMFHFGKYVMASSFVIFLNSNLDNIFIGKVLGAAMLGYYAISRNLSNFIGDYFFNKIGYVMYPAYSKLQDGAEDMKKALLKILGYLGVIIFPFSFGLFVFAPDILRIVLGEKWLPATDILRILSLVGIFNCLTTAISPIFLARGRSKADFQVNLAQVGVFFVLVIPLGIQFGLIGVGIASLSATIISFSVSLSRIRHILHIEIYKIFEALKPGLLCSLFMLLSILSLRSIVVTKNINYAFFISAGAAAAVYCLAINFVKKNIFMEIKEALI